MPKGIPIAGYRKTAKYQAKTVQDLEQDMKSKAPAYVGDLEQYVKPFPCPHCGNRIDIKDKEVLMYLVDHAIGKAKIRTELDITQNIVLNADQIESVIHKHLPRIVELYKTEIAGLLTEGVTKEGNVQE